MASLGDKFRDRASGKTVAATVSSLERKGDILTQIPIEQIRPDPLQPRKDMGDLTDLKASIVSVGILQPILVSVVGYEDYLIIAGERRYTAAKELGLEKIPAVVRTVEEHHRLELQIIENLHRKDLNALEEAESYQHLIDEFKYTQEELGKRLGKSQVSISETLKILALPAIVHEEYRTSDRISKSLLLEIAKQPDRTDQLSMWEQAKAGQLTVKKARQLKNSNNSRASSSRSTQSTQSTQMAFRYPIQTEMCVVTLTFEQVKVTQEEIVAALEEALAGERARLPVTS